MKLKPDPILRFKIRELLFIILIWFIATRVLVVFDFLSYTADASSYKSAKVYSILQRNLALSALLSVFIGSILGLIELFVIPKYFINKSAPKLLVLKMFSYIIVMYVASVLMIVSYRLWYSNLSLFEIFIDANRQIFTLSYLYLFVIGLLISFMIFILRFIRNKIGLGILTPMILGKYYTPKEEYRIFLFVDLKSSTQIAEKLGHIEYSKLLQDCYRDLAFLVLKYRGQIYQFVGDEAVMTWKVKKKTNFKDPVSLFFAFKERLESRAEYYKKNYNLIPEFKGSVNFGKVSTAEVGGDVKSELAFHGDVLNTAFRIMELCNKFKKDLLIADNIKKKIEPCDHEFKLAFQDKMVLKGKDKSIKIYSIEPAIKLIG